MKEINYKPSGICARLIHIEIDDNNKIQELKIAGGCDGNHKGLSALCKGMDASEVAEKLAGISCGWNPTSCPDQISKAIKESK